MTIEQVDPVLARIAALEAKIERLEARSEPPSVPDPEPESKGPVSRRRLIGMAGAAAAGAVGATALAATPAGANDPNDVTIDTSKSGVGTTQVNSSVATGSAAFFGNNTSSAANAIGVLGGATAGVGTTGSTDTGIGVHGFANGAGIGVRAFSFGGGTSLRVEAPPGDAGSHMLIAPHSAVSGPPTTSAHELGQFWVDNAGVLFQCTAAGTPGTWKRLALIGMANVAGADITQITSSSPSAVVQLNNQGTGSGIIGNGGNGASTGVHGTSAAGAGVVGSTDTGSAIIANQPASMGGAHLRLEPSTLASGAPTSGPHRTGQLWVGSSGDLFLCTANGDPGVWTKLNNQPGGGPSFTPLASAVRVFDSRAGQPNAGGTTQGALTFTSAPPSAAFRDVNCSQNAVGGAVIVPPGATTLLMNLAVVTLSGVGALNAYATGTAQPDTANINWSAGGQVLSNAVTSGCNAARHVNFAIVAAAGASTHLIVDVIGYYS